MQNIFNISFFLILVFISFFLNYYFTPIGLDLYHDGTQAKSTLDIYYGKTPYSETYVEYGSLTLLINKYFLNLLGIKIIYLKYLAGIYNFLLHTIFFLFNLIFFKNFKVSIFITLSLVLFENYMDVNYFDMSNSHLTILLFMLSCLSFLCFLRYKNNFFIFFISFFLFLSFFNKINYAVYSYIAFSVIFILFNFQKGYYNHNQKFLKNIFDNIFQNFSLKFQISFFLFLGSAIIYMAFKGIIIDWFIQTFINSIGVASSSRPLSQLFLELFPIPFIARHNPLYNYIYFIAAVSYIPYLIIYLKKFIRDKCLDDNNFEIFSLSILAFFLHLNYNPIIDTWHFYWSSPLLLFFLFLSIKKILIYFNFDKIKLSIIIYFLILLPAFSFLFYKTFINKLTQDYIVIKDIDFLNGMKLKNYEYNFFKEIDTNFENDPRLLDNQYIVDLTKYPKSFFLAMYHNKLTKKFYFDYKTISNNAFYYDNYDSYLENFIILNHPIIITDNKYLPSYVDTAYEEIVINTMDEYYEKKPGNKFNILVPLK